MKALKFISILGLCVLAVCSCKKDNDDDLGIVGFSQFGMQAYFPADEWRNSTGDSDILGNKTEDVETFLKESMLPDSSYSIFILFKRFVDPFEKEDVDKLTTEIKAAYDYWASIGIEYLSVDAFESSSIGDYPALKLNSKKINNSIEESYFIHHENRLYWISLVIPENEMNKHYSECKKILDTFKISSN